MELARQLRRKMALGEVVFGTFVCEMKTAGVAAILHRSGFDYLILDMEHGLYDPDQAGRIIDSAKRHGICTIVRVPWHEPGMISRILDAGAEGILVPMIRTMEEVDRAVSAAKYAPVGRRGLHPIRPHTDFVAPASMETYCREANANLILGIQVETCAAVELIEPIAANPGVDMVFVGPGDLSAEMGNFQGLSHPDVFEVVRRVWRACDAHGKIASSHSGSFEDIRRVAEVGVKMISNSDEMTRFHEGASGFIAGAREALGG